MRLSRARQDEAIDRLLGDLEAAVMRLMWQRESATVRDILDALNLSGRPLAYTTVMTVMSRLVVKGVLARERSGKTHIYRTAATEEQFLQHAAAQRVHALIEEFGDLAITHFIIEISELSPKRRQQLEQMVKGDEA